MFLLDKNLSQTPRLDKFLLDKVSPLIQEVAHVRIASPAMVLDAGVAVRIAGQVALSHFVMRGMYHNKW